MTPNEHINIAVEQLQDCLRDGRVFHNRLMAERGGMVVAVAMDFHPANTNAIAGLLFGGYRADAVVMVSDMWCYEGKRPDDRTPQQLFEAGVPGAGEAMACHYMTMEGSRYLQAEYVKATDGTIVVTKVVERREGTLSGRALIDQDTVRKAADAARMMLQGMEVLEMPAEAADVIVSKVIGRVLAEESPQTELSCLVAVDTTDADAFHEFARANGLELIADLTDEDLQ